MENVKIIIGADIVPTETNVNRFIEGDAPYLFGDSIMRELETADIRVFNLEVPLVNEEQPINKCGPNLIAPRETIAAIKQINPSCLVLANNHILDQGVEGVESTIDVLEQNKISYIGVGKDVDEASKAWIVEVGKLSIGFFACAEHEFSIVSEGKIGANPFDPLISYEKVKKIKECCDYVVVLYHGGKEHYRYPSPNLQRYCRKFIESGADLVVCQHSHCIGCKEEYAEGIIIYGQGNFLFDRSQNECWQTSILIEVLLDEEHIKLEYIPLQKVNDSVRMADEKQSKIILDGFVKRSEEITKDGFVEENYKKYASEHLYENLARIDFLSKNLFIRLINKLSGGQFRKWYLEKLYLPKMKYVLWNTIECEAWCELLLCGLRNDKGNK